MPQLVLNAIAVVNIFALNFRNWFVIGQGWPLKSPLFVLFYTEMYLVHSRSKNSQVSLILLSSRWGLRFWILLTWNTLSAPHSPQEQGSPQPGELSAALVQHTCRRTRTVHKVFRHSLLPAEPSWAVASW